MSLSHQIDTVLSKSLLKPQRYQNHRISTNLFSSSVKITNEGVDKHSLEEKSTHSRFWQLLYYPDKYFADERFYRLSTFIAHAPFVTCRVKV